MNPGARHAGPAASTPQVSVLLLSYNQKPFLETAMASICSQGVPIQLIVIDDGSSDGSQRVLSEIISARLGETTLVLHETNEGVSRSLNEGLRHVQAPFVAVLAADDMWLPGKLSRQLSVMAALPAEVGVVYTDALLCDQHGTLLPDRFIGHRCRALPEPRPSGWLFRDLLEGNFIPAPSTLIRRRCFDDLGGFDETLALEDFEFWLRLSLRYQFHYDDVVQTVYRVHTGSAVHSRYHFLRQDLWRIYERHLSPATATPRAATYVSNLAFYLYSEGDENGLRLLWMSLRYRLNWRALLLLLPAVLGLRGPRARRFKRAVTARKPAAMRVIRQVRHLASRERPHDGTSIEL